jgi:hypothetical protein
MSGRRWLRIMAVDPGGTTGVAGGSFRVGKNSMAKDVMQEADGDGRIWTAEVEGSPREQAAELNQLWQSLSRTGPTPLLVIEDFVLRSQNADLTPVAVTAALEALVGFDIERQMPSAAKSFLTNDRMHDWGLWVVGSAHERDAIRHVALKLSREM